MNGGQHSSSILYSFCFMISFGIGINCRTGLCHEIIRKAAGLVCNNCCNLSRLILDTSEFVSAYHIIVRLLHLSEIVGV